MSADSLLDEAFTRLLGKLEQVAEDSVPRTCQVTINFSGGGSALPSAGGLPAVIEIPYASSIVWVHLYAGDENLLPIAVTSTIDVRATILDSFDGGSAIPIYGSTLPGLTAQSSLNVDITAWSIRNFDAGDTLTFRMASFSGTATWMAMCIQLRATDVLQGSDTVTGPADEVVTDEDGNPVVTRS